MKFFERGPRPHPHSELHAGIAAELAEGDRLERQARYSQARSEQLRPLLDEAEDLKIDFEIAKAKLDATKAAASRDAESSSLHAARERLRQFGAELKGEVYNSQAAHVPENPNLADANRHFADVQAKLDAVQAEIEVRSSALRAQFGLSSGG